MAPATAIIFAAAAAANPAWGPTNLHGKAGCPIRYPFKNETHFCTSVGRQRALVMVSATAEVGSVACTNLEWRRRDSTVDRGVFVLNSTLGFRPAALDLTQSNRTVGRVCWQTNDGVEAASMTTTYAIYYAPFAWSFNGGSGSYHSHFLSANATAPVLPPSSIPTATTAPDMSDAAMNIEWQAFSSFDDRSPMELIASPAEIAALAASMPPSSTATSPVLTWASAITNTTAQTPRMKELPHTLAMSPPNNSVTLDLTPGVATHFQILLYVVPSRAAGRSVTGVGVTFSAPASAAASVLPESAFSCYQTSGYDYKGRVMKELPPVHVNAGEVGQLLIAVAPPAEACAKRAATTSVAAAEQWTVNVDLHGLGSKLSITVLANLKCDAREAQDDLWNLGRMAWLNSRIGLDESLITRPYQALRLVVSDEEQKQAAVAGTLARVECLGRVITLGATGLPSAITSNGRSVLAAPMTFDVVTKQQNGQTKKMAAYDASPSSFTSSPIVFGPGNSSASWRVVFTDDGLRMTIEGTLDYDGHLDYAVILSATTSKPVALASATLHTLIPASLARFADGAGMGDNGGFFDPNNCSEQLDWMWTDPSFNASGPAGNPNDPTGWRIWLGDVDAGVYLKLKGPELVWNEASPRTPPKGTAPTPKAWANGGRGGINVSMMSGAADSSMVNVAAYGGARMLNPGDDLIFNFSLLATPVKGDYTTTAVAKYEHYVKTRHFHVPYGEWDPPAPSDLKKTLGKYLPYLPHLHTSTKVLLLTFLPYARHHDPHPPPIESTESVYRLALRTGN